MVARKAQKAETVPWAADPHTLVKHALYRQYFGKWFPIMINGRWDGDVTYAEGFSGPGVYLGGHPGSPVIAFNAIPTEGRAAVKAKAIRMLFVDDDQRCIDILRSELAKSAAPLSLAELPRGRGITVDIEPGLCEPRLLELLDAHAVWGKPILMVLDSWGTATSFDLVRRIAGNPSSEVLITMGPNYFARFAEKENEAVGDMVYGESGWRNVARLASDQKSQWLRQRYRETILRAGFQHVLDFELVDAGGRPLYLFFGTTHPLGLRKMKEAMWEVDDVNGIGYRDPRDPGQETLPMDFEMNLGALRRLLVQHLATRPERKAFVHQLREFALYETVYKESQVKPALGPLIDSGQVRRLAPRGTLQFVEEVQLVRP